MNLYLITENSLLNADIWFRSPNKGKVFAIKNLKKKKNEYQIQARLLQCRCNVGAA